MPATEYQHIPVLLNEVLSFVPSRRLTYVDMTLGRGGHAKEILKRIKEGSLFYGVDKDEEAIRFCQDFLKPFEKKVSLNYLHAPFSKAIGLLKDSGVEGADLILMDIGVSSPQFDDPSRGFSYRYDAPLDMRMDQNTAFLTASDIVNTYSEKELCRVFRDLGEVRDYYPVVRKILAVREEKKIETTFELVDIIKEALPRYDLQKIGHPAKQFFLGLRYEVNHEIDELKQGLEESIRFLNAKGRLLIISFNSEEDRIVKTIFRTYTTKKAVDKYHPLMDEKDVEYLALTKKPIVPTEEEILENNRCKPSILRALERK